MYNTVTGDIMLSYYKTYLILLIKKVIHSFLTPFCILILNLNVFNKYQAHLLRTWYYPKKRSLIDKILYYPFFIAWINRIYLKEPDPLKREELKAQCMGSSAGAEWAKYYDSFPITDEDIKGSKVGGPHDLNNNIFYC